MPDQTFTDFLEERLATYEGGTGSIVICYDEATSNYTIFQLPTSIFSAHQTLGCSKTLGGAIHLAITGKIYED